MASSIWPVLHYDDPEAVVEFLVEVVGFEERLRVHDGDGDVVHAELRWPRGGVVTIGGTKHAGGAHAHMRPGGAATYVVADDVDALHARVAASDDARVVMPPADTSFGAGTIAVRAFTVSDREGNLWTFGTYG